MVAPISNVLIVIAVDFGGLAIAVLIEGCIVEILLIFDYLIFSVRCLSTRAHRPT